MSTDSVATAGGLATALADPRELGMTWSPIGVLRAPSSLSVRGRLVREGGER